MKLLENENSGTRVCAIGVISKLAGRGEWQLDIVTIKLIIMQSRIS
jgi:hypothetical protein